MRKSLIILSIGIGLIFLACARDMTEPVQNSCSATHSYDTDIKQLIDSGCAISGCHDGNGGAPGNYTSYQGIENILNNGLFTTRVFDLKDNPDIGMPPDYAESFGGFNNYTEEQLNILMTWVSEGFPESAVAVSATYNESVKLVIDNTCAYAGCHNGSPGVPGNYMTYEGLRFDLENGDFMERVVDLVDDPVIGMPPDRAVNFGGPADLTPEEFELILCWIENGYPEN